MIPKQAFITYAQYREDIILSALFYDVKKGFYVDVGANYPTIDSVTKYFYLKGWNGINIEPIHRLHKMLLEERPNDINLGVGVGEKNGSSTLREYIDTPGHSTFDESHKSSNNQPSKFKEYTVEISTLENVLKTYKVKLINFLKIDVEGYEYEVLKGMNWKIRPEVICIEANQIGKDWRPILAKAKYKLFISDGLNNYYVAEESWYRTEGYAERVVKLDYDALRKHQYDQWSVDTRELNDLKKYTSELSQQNKTQKAQLDRVESRLRLSLRDVSYPRRLKRTIYGLTIDWLNYKGFHINKSHKKLW